MRFYEQINHYIDSLNCTAKELSCACGLSPTVISRYRSGERQPTIESEQLSQLAKGIAALANARSMPDLSEQAVLAQLQASLKTDTRDYDNFFAHFNALFSQLDINMKSLATSLNFDVSFLYRVRSGERKPNDLSAFCSGLSRYIVNHYNATDDKAKVATLLGCHPSDIDDNEEYMNRLGSWLFSAPTPKSDDQMESFLKKMDTFDLNEYIRVIRFDELKVPTAPFLLPVNKTYYGVEQMRTGELDFFKSTVLSKSKAPIFMHSDMPMEGLAKDLDFNKKWMFGIAASIKKGLHIDIIHCLDRPFEELLLGLEAWIPIYMTGQVTPYHLPNNVNKVYHHLTYVSGAAALCGECIDGYHEDGKYELTNNKETIAYYRKKADHLLSMAQPLMEIYNTQKREKYDLFMKSDAKNDGKRHHILSSLPLYSIDPVLLESILKRSSVSDIEIKRILNHREQEAAYMSMKLAKGSVCDEIIIPSKEEYKEHPMHVSLSGCFYEQPISYTYEDMLSHFEQTKAYAQANPGYSLKTANVSAFRNIQIQILENQYVVISKITAPVIHFVIHHPTLVNALQNFTIPVVE